MSVFNNKCKSSTLRLIDCCELFIYLFFTNPPEKDIREKMTIVLDSVNITWLLYTIFSVNKLNGFMSIVCVKKKKKLNQQFAISCMHVAIK